MCYTVQLQGSPAVEAANDRFSATMTNVVRWSDAAASAAGAQRKQLRSDTEIQVKCPEAPSGNAPIRGDDGA